MAVEQVTPAWITKATSGKRFSACMNMASVKSPRRWNGISTNHWLFECMAV